MPKRSEQSVADLDKRLPEFEVEISNDYDGWLLVTCPRDDCGLTFLVERRPWTKTMHSKVKPEVVLHGRSCPYCYRASRIPKIRKRTSA